MHLKRLEVVGFKSFGNKATFHFDAPITAIVGPNGSGKSNVVESIRFVLGEQSMKSLRGGSSSDLIFKSPNGRSMQRASVALVFDNSKRLFQMNSGTGTIGIDFDEIELAREVYSDGSSIYRINGTQVRLRDILELIGSVNIGPSGHHIISQGEADRLLSASIRDRRSMLEEALGLKVYQYRILESERKLMKTREHVREVRSLIRELEPHMRYLRKQLDRLEQAESLRVILLEKTAHVSARIAMMTKDAVDHARARHTEISAEIQQLNAQEESLVVQLQGGSEMSSVETARIQRAMQDLIEREHTIMRQLGKVEALIEHLEKESVPVSHSAHPSHVATPRVHELLGVIRKECGAIRSCGTISEVVDAIARIETRLDRFEDELILVAPNQADIPDIHARVQDARAELETHEIALSEVVSERLRLQSELERISQESQERMQSLRDAERELGKVRSDREKLLAARTLVEREISDHTENLENVDRLVAEVVQLAGDIPSISLDDSQEVSIRDVERLKIKFEELGGGVGVEVRDEWNETSERHAFLTREIDDAEHTCTELERLLVELNERLHNEFMSGLHKINAAFQTFFVHMFGGGGAEVRLSEIKNRKKTATDEDEEVIDDEEKETEYGVEVRVQLPRKRVQDLTMLSGGERSLTSIALLFALSQVNPPPFVVLDETDAALDEANSRKYGAMLRELSSHAQLVVVTHNRETMASAHQLFGVTIGADGSSQVVSVKLDQAVSYAK